MEKLFPLFTFIGIEKKLKGQVLVGTWVGDLVYLVQCLPSKPNHLIYVVLILCLSFIYTYRYLSNLLYQKLLLGNILGFHFLWSRNAPLNCFQLCHHIDLSRFFVHINLLHFLGVLLISTSNYLCCLKD